MRVVVTGGRDYAEYFDSRGVPLPWKTLEEALAEEQHVWDFLSDVDFPIDQLAQGFAKRGADKVARRWARINLGHENSFDYPADWSQGKKAGPLRNQFMLDHFGPWKVIAFPGGSGTENCCIEAVKRRIDVIFA